MIDYSQTFLDILVPIFLPKLANGDEEYYLIQGFMNADAPVKDYASIVVTSVVDVGTLEEGNITTHGQQVKQHQEVTLRINTFGKGAYSAASRLAKSLPFPSMTQKLTSAGVALRGHTNVTNITQLIQTAYEERATFEIVLGVADGNFSDGYDPSKEGQPSQPLFDEDIVPVTNVQISVGVTPSNDPSQDILDVGTVIIDTNS